MHKLLRTVGATAIISRFRPADAVPWSEEVLQQSMAHRHRALTAQPRPDVLARQEQFLARSNSYHHSLASGDSRLAGFSMDQVDMAGLKWWIPADNRKPKSLSDRLLHAKRLPLREILRSRELAIGTAMIDLGANVGTTSIPRVVLGDFQYVYAAEPAPGNYAALVQNVVANGLSGYVLPDMVAIGSTTGDVRLKLSNKIGNHKVISAAKPLKSGPRRVSVPSLTLDDWVEHHQIDLDRVTFVKCDTQGWEGHVLRGAEGVLRRKHVAWHVELSPKGVVASGMGIEEVLERLASSFTHFIDLWEEDAAARIQSTTKLNSRVAHVAKVGSNEGYVDLLFYNA